MKYNIFLILLLQINNFNLCYNFNINSKCCPNSDQILNTNFYECVYKDHQISIQSNINELPNNSLVNYTTLVLPDAINSSKINLPCEFQNIEVLYANEFNIISQSDILTPMVIKGVKEFNSSEYCWDKVKNEDEVKGIVALTCPCLRGPCVHVCCEKGKILHLDSEFHVSCENTTDEFLNWTLKGYLEPNKEEQNYFTVYGEPPHCNEEEITTRSFFANNQTLPVRKDGLLNIQGKNSTFKSRLASTYCIVPFKNHNETIIETFVCEKNGISDAEKLHSYIYTPLFILGALFLLATIVVYIMLPELRNAVRGLSLMAHCACMFVAHVTLTIIQTSTRGLHRNLCTTLGFLSQFALLTAFFWMNVMCIDISSAFRSMQRMAAEYQMLKSKEIKKFSYYAIYAMGIPLIILIMTIYSNENELVPESIRPHIGHGSCWFGKEDKYAIFVFFYGPIGLLLLLNFALFILTVYKIYTFSKQTAFLDRHDSQRHDKKSSQRKSIILFTKLFGLMGITWVMEILSWVFDGQNYQIIWYFTDAINLLRSVFIFILFCCKPKVWNMLKTKYPWIRIWKSMSSSSEQQQQHQLQSLG